MTTLLGLETCNGRVGATGMCLGGHLAYRCALDVRVAAAVCYFATDIHGHSLGAGLKDDSLERAGDIKGELVMVRKTEFFYPFFYTPYPLPQIVPLPKSLPPQPPHSLTSKKLCDGFRYLENRIITSRPKGET